MAVEGLLSISLPSIANDADSGASSTRAGSAALDFRSDAVRIVRDRLSVAAASRRAGEIAGLSGGRANASAASSIVQIADNALTEIDARLKRMKTIATQASASLLKGETHKTPLSDQDRAILDTEFTRLRAEITEIVDLAKFENTELLKGDGGSSTLTLAINVGGGPAAGDTITLSLEAATVANLSTNLATASLTTEANADLALAEVTAAVNKLDQTQATVRAAGNSIQGAAAAIERSAAAVETQKEAATTPRVSVEFAQLVAEHTLEERGVSALLHDSQLLQQLAATLGKVTVQPAELHTETGTGEVGAKPAADTPARTTRPAPRGGGSSPDTSAPKVDIAA